MSLIHPNSALVVPSPLEIFRIVPTEATAIDTNVVQYRPKNSGDAGVATVFEITGNTAEYLKPGQTYFSALVRILKSNRQAIAAGAQVGPVNNFGHALIASCVVELEGVVVSSNSINYPYRSNMTIQLNYGQFLIL